MKLIRDGVAPDGEIDRSANDSPWSWEESQSLKEHHKNLIFACGFGVGACVFHYFYPSESELSDYRRKLVVLLSGLSAYSFYVVAIALTLASLDDSEKSFLSKLCKHFTFRIRGQLGNKRNVGES